MPEIYRNAELPTPIAKKPAKRFKPIDIAALVVVLLIIAALGYTLFTKLALKNEVAAGKVVAQRVVSDLAKKNSHDVYVMSNKKFQSSRSEAELQNLFTNIAAVTKGTPSLDRQTVFDSSKIKNVAFIYKYQFGKVPFYVRVITTKADTSNSWQVSGLSGNPDESQLIIK